MCNLLISALSERYWCRKLSERYVLVVKPVLSCDFHSGTYYCCYGIYQVRLSLFLPISFFDRLLLHECSLQKQTWQSEVLLRTSDSFWIGPCWISFYGCHFIECAALNGWKQNECEMWFESVITFELSSIFIVIAIYSIDFSNSAPSICWHGATVHIITDEDCSNHDFLIVNIWISNILTFSSVTKVEIFFLALFCRVLFFSSYALGFFILVLLLINWVHDCCDCYFSLNYRDDKILFDSQMIWLNRLNLVGGGTALSVGRILRSIQGLGAGRISGLRFLLIFLLKFAHSEPCYREDSPLNTKRWFLRALLSLSFLIISPWRQSLWPISLSRFWRGKIFISRHEESWTWNARKLWIFSFPCWRKWVGISA